MLILGGVIFGLVNIVGASVQQFREDIPEYQVQLTDQYNAALDWIEERGIDVPQDRLEDFISPATINNVIQGVVGPVTRAVINILTDSLLILIMVIFILLEASTFPDKIRAVAKDPSSQIANIDYLAVQVFRYFAIKTATSAATGLFIWAWLAIAGIDYALLWGLLAFLLNYIPNIGSLIAAIPAVLLALVTEGLGGGVIAGIGFLVVNNVIGSFLEPRVMGDGLGLSPLVVFLSLIFWGWVFGPIGMLLSAPLTMAIKIVLQTIPETRWIAVMLSGGKYVRFIVDQKPEAIDDPDRRAAAEVPPPDSDNAKSILAEDGEKQTDAQRPKD
jgi:predicted PurR-regulated permease PerM